ncbi:MAG: amidase family protein [Alphaproteobacteria bacterium]|nr:amidase family protein [Alphaproteobacteria bacterium]
MSDEALRIIASLLLYLWPVAASAFHLQEATIGEIHRAILARELTATALVGLYLKRIDAYNGQCVKGDADAGGLVLGAIEPVEHAGKLGALMTLNIRGRRSRTAAADSAPDMPDALDTARALDDEFARTGRLKGPLHGVVFAIKDQFDTFDMRSTSGAAAGYANDRPPRDAEIVARLRAAGAIILAKSNMGEYASGDRSTYGGTTCNPYDTSRSAGRSSGGSGAAVAANLVTCAMGEETGPSARNPAANGSIVGIVATHSLVSRAGIIPASLTRDRPGILCRTVKDAATVLGAVAGYDPRDPATAASDGQVRGGPYPDNADNANLQGVRLGVVREFMQVHTKADEDSVAIAEAALRDLAKAGAILVDPGPGGALFQDALADILPALDTPALAAVFAFPPGTDIVENSVAMAGKAGKLPPGLTLRVVAERDVPAPGEVRFALERYLRDRGDANIRTVADLIARSTFYDHPPIAGVTLAPKGRLGELLTPTQRLTRKSDGRPLVRKLDNTALDISGWHANRTVLQMLINKVMADNKLDALVYPTKTVLAPRLAEPVEPINLRTVQDKVTLVINGEEYEHATERVIDLRAPLTPRLSPNSGFPAIVVPAGFATQVYDRAVVRGADGSKRAGDFLAAKAVELPVSIDFLGRAFSEPLLIRIAAGYEAATRHRRPPRDFGPVGGEP